MTIIINVIGQQIAVKGHKVPLAPHSENFIKLTFLLSSKWKNFKTFAQFRQSNNPPVNVYLDESNSVYVPREIKAGNFTVMLYGAGESIIGTTNCLIFDMVDNCFSADAIETDLTPTLYQQLLNEFKSYLASTKANSESATASENASKSYATAANASATASATSAGESEQSKTQAQEYAQNAYNSAVGAESAKDDAENARDEIRSMRAEAVTLSPGSDATASYSDGLLSLGIPRGDKGETGATGATGPKGDTGEQGPKGDKGDPGEVTQAEFDEALAKKSPVIYEEIESVPIATFADGAEDMSLKDLKVAIEPVQKGTGDPSPDNVRPISGWTGAKVTRTRGNLFNVRACTPFNQNVTLTFNDDGSMTCENRNSYVNIPTTSAVLNLPSGTYTVSTDGTLLTNVTLYASDDGVNYAWYANGLNASTKNRTVTIDKPYVQLRWQVSANSTDTLPPIMFEYGSTYHSYEPYQGDTYDIAFPTEAGTVYGGSLDVTTGVLTVDRAQIASYNGETLPEKWISDRDVYAAGASPTTGAQVVYELATPITYHLTPQEITTLLGQNNIWADTGDTSVTYKADTKLYIDKKFTELQALILEN